jgi:Fe-S cluster assembly protein SufD
MTFALIKTEAETALETSFAALKNTLPGLAGLREKAFAHFVQKGLPHRRVEEWKYTDWRGLMRDAAPPAARPSVEEIDKALGVDNAFSGLEQHRFSFVNGFCVQQSQALPAGITVLNLEAALSQNHPLLQYLSGDSLAQDNVAVSLNAAFMSDCLIVHVAKHTQIATPLHFQFLHQGNAPFSATSRVLMVLEDGADLAMLETHQGPNDLAYHSNHMVQMVVGAGAHVRHIRLNEEGQGALAISTVSARLGSHAKIDSLNMVSGARVSRHQVFVACEDEHATAGIRGATMLKHQQLGDTTLIMDHAKPHGTSRELFKTIIDDAATGVFQGKIIVRPQAQKTDGRMMSACLLLSDQASMNNKPELEIFADDVQCAHGATCGQLDDDLLFYLMARGLPRKEAEALLIQSFVGEALEEGIEDENLRDIFSRKVFSWLEQR